MGSKRASLQEWRVNLENLTVSIVRERKRQLVPNAKRFDVKLIAKHLAEAILSGHNDERFKIMSDGGIKIEMRRVIPETNAQTTWPVEGGFEKHSPLSSSRMAGRRFEPICMHEVRGATRRDH